MFIKIKDYRIDKAYISSYEPYDSNYIKDEAENWYNTTDVNKIEYEILIQIYRADTIRISYGKGEAGRKQRDEDIALLDRELLNKDK